MLLPPPAAFSLRFMPPWRLPLRYALLSALFRYAAAAVYFLPSLLPAPLCLMMRATLRYDA